MASISKAHSAAARQNGKLHGGRKPRPYAQRVEEFWIKVHIGEPSDCWRWTGYVNDRNYGQVYWDGKVMVAHRVAFLLTHGSIRDGMKICHKCDNPSCCNPNHLFEGTDADNVHDCITKGRNVAPPRTAKLTNSQAEYILRNYVPFKVTIPQLARKFRVGVGSVTAVLFNPCAWIDVRARIASQRRQGTSQPG